jgi:hypothetical protein
LLSDSRNCFVYALGQSLLRAMGGTGRASCRKAPKGITKEIKIY